MASTLIHTDIKPSHFFSTAAPYLVITPRFPQGILARIVKAIAGTDCFLMQFERDMDKPESERGTVYAMASELD